MYESHDERQYWPDEVIERVEAEEAAAAEEVVDTDCCIPRAVGSVAIEAATVAESFQERQARINSAANDLRSNKGAGRELTEQEESRIDTIWDTGQDSADGAFYKVVGMTKSRFYGDPTFNFNSPQAVDYASDIISEEYPRKTKELRPRILRYSLGVGDKEPKITAQEAEDLVRLIELRTKKS